MRTLNAVSRLATVTTLVAITWLSMPATHAAPIGIDWVTVGNAGNVNDPSTGNQYGAVAYDFQIMRHEFTNSQYVAFLNAVDPDGSNPQGIWNSSLGTNVRGGISFTSGNSAGSKYAARTNMGDKPVNWVSWFDAARVANWLHNGAQTYGNTDSSASAPQNTGAYTVGTATSGDAVSRNEGALFYVPTENEWYKAAFYNPTLNGGAGGYRLYGNGFDTRPGIVSANEFGVGSAGGTGNFANHLSGAAWNGLNGIVTTVGTNGGSSYYGAFDMSGNIAELNDLTGAAGSSRGLRGGFWSSDDGNFPVSSSSRFTPDPSFEYDIFGFRLARPVAVPEPSTWAMAGIGIACAGWGAFRRRRAR